MIRGVSEPPDHPEPDQPPDGLPRLTRLAAYGVLCRGGRVLLCRVAPGYLGTGIWTLPGGGLEFGEGPEEAVVREVDEETGFAARITGQPRILSDTGVWPFPTGSVSYHHVRFVYPMEIVGGAERREVSGSTDEVAWFTPDEVDELERDGRLGDLVRPALP
jgi:ADP-ribose pyrophosphatase YjhB (NUDIX family)